MLVSFTIFNKGGLILYQHSDEEEASSFSRSSNSSLSDSINTWLTDVYLNPTKSLTDRKASIDGHPTKVVVEWEETSDLIAVALYPDIRHEDFPWIRNLLLASLQDFQIFQQAQQQENTVHPNQPIDDTTLFDKTFQILFKQHKNSHATVAAKQKMNTHKQTTAAAAAAAKRGGAGGKEKRNWHDGKAKVTKEAMAVLDFSKSKTNNTEEQDVDDDQVALAEARAAYLPTDADLADFEMVPTPTLVDDDNDEDENSENSWGNSLKGLFQQVTGNKVLTKQDLQLPLQEMHKLLASKNVASGIAQQICTNVESSLVGKKLSSMYRVKTAVRQALEKAVNKLLSPSTQLDLLRQVVSKRDSLFGKRRPYVIVVVGINGVGKSTSLAKLAYYLKSNGCHPLLAACDTFRSGAVEQLSVHAKCLELPIFSQGYSKDPSSVAKAAIAQAEKEGNDVVLVDTAGRMQNNVPLMKALGKLAQENQPDMVVFVGEALVGNDGVDQVRMFNQAVSSFSRTQKVNAILLTKFDTVSDKVGAALTMTHVTNAPILFVGTGQKYHHLKKLSTQSVIQSLFQ
jgi:signal recognition particle receptor subunit alpha